MNVLTLAGLLVGATLLCLLLIGAFGSFGPNRGEQSQSVALHSSVASNPYTDTSGAPAPASADPSAQNRLLSAQPSAEAPATSVAPIAEPTTALPAPTFTPIPSPTPAPTFTPTPHVAPTTDLSPSIALSGFRHAWQTWNNCGPATLAMNLSYFGSTLDQGAIGAAIRKHPDDKNVNTEELAAFARQQGFAAEARVNGDGELVRRFLNHQIPVLIETWLEPEPNDGFGHYRLLTGYDEAEQRWIAHDSYVGENLVNPDPQAYAGIYLPYDETDRLWAVYNRAYVLIYHPHQAELVRTLLGEQAQVAVSPFAWFNLGGALYHLDRAQEAASAFDRARAIGLPWRMLWYQFEPFAAYYAVGRYADVVELARATLATTQSLEEVQTWYGKGLAALGDRDGARAALNYALELNPDLVEARNALANLE